MRFKPFASVDAKVIDEAVAPIAQAGYLAIHDIVLINGRVDHVVVGPSGVYAVQPSRVRIARDTAKRRATDASVLVRRQLAASGNVQRVLPVVVPLSTSEPKEVSEFRSHAVVEIGSLASWLKGRVFRLEPLVLEAVKMSLTPHHGDDFLRKI